MNRATKSYLILALCVLTFLQMPIATEPPCSTSPADGFVKSTDAHLCLNGREFKAIGVNSYGILAGYLGIGQINSQAPDPNTRLKEASENGLQIVRFWLDVQNSDYWFGRVYSKYNESQNHASYFTALDRLVSDAKSNRVLLVPVLATAYGPWSRLGNGENFWLIGSQTNLKFKEWVASIVGRYSNETQIAWWEIANEANYSAMSGSNRVGLSTVISWAADMYHFVKSQDSNHLVSGGFNNTGNLDLDQFGQLNQPFDIASIHIYEDDLYGLERGRGVLDNQAAIQAFVESYSKYSRDVLDKPLVFGEFNGDELTPNAWFVEKFLSVSLKNGNGALIWVWEEGPPTDSYYVSPSSTPEIVRTLRSFAMASNVRPQ